MKQMIVLALLMTGSVSQANYGILGANFSAPTINGKDNVYGPVAGEIIYDYSDSTFYGRNHTNAWIALGGAASPDMPVGSILTFAGATCPTGYLAANGAAVSRSDYGALFAVIGTTHGQGDGSSTFNVPDYRGRFLRGADGTAGNDPDKNSRTAMNAGGNSGNNVGSVQSDSFQGHFHDGFGDNGGTGSPTGAVGNLNSAAVSSGYVSPTKIRAHAGAAFSDGVNGTPRVSSETRAKNAYVNYCIKN